MTTSSIEQHLIAARALLARPYGWCKGTYEKRRKHGGYAYCAVGAALATVVDNSEAAVELLIAQIPVPEAYAWSVSIFNDAPTTRKKDILALYDRAIAKAKEARG